MNYKSKYLKYKLKYLKEKQLCGGSSGASSDELNKIFKNKTDLNHPSGIPFEDSPTISGKSGKSDSINEIREAVVEELKMYSRHGPESDENVLGVEIGDEIDNPLPKFSNKRKSEVKKTIVKPKPKRPSSP